MKKGLILNEKPGKCSFIGMYTSYISYFDYDKCVVVFLFTN